MIKSLVNPYRNFIFLNFDKQREFRYFQFINQYGFLRGKRLKKAIVKWNNDNPYSLISLNSIYRVYKNFEEKGFIGLFTKYLDKRYFIAGNCQAELLYFCTQEFQIFSLPVEVGREDVNYQAYYSAAGFNRMVADRYIPFLNRFGIIKNQKLLEATLEYWNEINKPCSACSRSINRVYRAYKLQGFKSLIGKYPERHKEPNRRKAGSL